MVGSLDQCFQDSLALRTQLCPQPYHCVCVLKGKADQRGGELLVTQAGTRRIGSQMLAFSLNCRTRVGPSPSPAELSVLNGGPGAEPECRYGEGDSPAIALQAVG